MFNRSYVPLNSSDINGIIHKLKNVKVTCKSIEPAMSGSSCMNAINISHDFHFCGSRNTYDQWLSLSFPRIKIYLTHYSIQAPNIEAAPKSWKFFGKKEGKWILLDTVKESKLNTAFYSVLTRRVSEEGPFNEFNVTTNETNYKDRNEFRIHKIDVFGFISDSHCTLHCKRERSIINFIDTVHIAS